MDDPQPIEPPTRGFSGQCAGFGEDSRGARDAKWAQQFFNGAGRDGKGPLFV